MPPLSALRAFEVAARHESFARAAAELGVTAAAVSHQIKALEAWLGMPLFARRAQGLQLTPEGRAAVPALSRAFDALGSVALDLRAASPSAQLNIAALPSIAQLWLGPRLSQLRAAFPHVNASIYALEEPPDFRREPFDLAIFFVADGAGPGRKRVLGRDRIYPVCSPEIARRLKSPRDLARFPRLSDATWSDDWSRWSSAAGIANVSANGGQVFSLFSLAVQAAIEGAGVLIGHEALVGAPIAAGSLVAPFEIRVETASFLSILAPDRVSSQAEAIMDWLTRQV